MPYRKRPRTRSTDSTESSGRGYIIDSSDDEPPSKYIYLKMPQGSVETLDGIIAIAQDIEQQVFNYYDISAKRKRPTNLRPAKLKALYNILPDLLKLQELVGLTDLKNQIAMQIIFIVQGLNVGEMMHTAIMGPPGMGKTTVCEIIARIYSKLGFLSENKVVMAKRSSLIGQYLGETAIKTMDVLKSAKGGVLLIDEAYQLGSHGGRVDSFSAECLNTLNQYLSENTRNFMCIVAGYKEQMYKAFFNANPGLDRRFPWKFNVTEYSSSDLAEVLEYQLREKNWTIHQDTDFKNIFKKDRDLFKNNGGDTLVLFEKCKMAYAQRTFMLKPSNFTSKEITKADFDAAYKLFKELKNVQKDASSDSWKNMFL